MAPPTTISGTISDKNVSRISPGTMISANPTPMAMLAKIPAIVTLPQERQRRLDGRAQVEVDPPVAGVLHGLDQRRLQQEDAEQAEQAAEDGAEGTERQAQQRGDDGDHQVDRERDEKEVRGVALVQRPRLAQDTGERVHALIVKIYLSVTYA